MLKLTQPWDETVWVKLHSDGGPGEPHPCTSQRSTCGSGQPCKVAIAVEAAVVTNLGVVTVLAGEMGADEEPRLKHPRVIVGANAVATAHWTNASNWAKRCPASSSVSWTLLHSPSSPPNPVTGSRSTMHCTSWKKARASWPIASLASVLM